MGKFAATHRAFYKYKYKNFCGIKFRITRDTYDEQGLSCICTFDRINGLIKVDATPDEKVIPAEELLEFSTERRSRISISILTKEEILGLWCDILSITEYGTGVMDFKNTFREEVSRRESVYTKADLLDRPDRFIMKIERPIYMREPENTNIDTFDFIKVYITLPSSNNCTNDELLQGLKKHRKFLCNEALNAIQNDRSFKKYKVPVNILKLSKLNIVLNIRRAELIFELKSLSGGA